MIVAILFVITTIIELILNNYKKNIYNKLVSLLSLKKYDEFTELIEDKKTKFFLPVNNYHILKMNEAMLQQRTNDIIFEIDKLKNLKLTEEQKTFVYCRAFSYFLTGSDIHLSERGLAVQACALIHLTSKKEKSLRIRSPVVRILLHHLQPVLSDFRIRAR